jgi:imidazolonepropionase-like amidohydrolase
VKSWGQTMTEDTRRGEKAAGEARYLLAGALFLGAFVPYLFAMAALAGSLRDGFDTFWRWSLLFFLYWAPLGIFLFRTRLRMGWRLLAAYLASVPLYAVCLWAIYPTAGGSFRPFRNGIWPIYLSASPAIFLCVACLYFIFRSRGWLAKTVSWLACIVFVVGALVPVAVWARTDAYKWPRAGNRRLAIVNSHIVSLGEEPASAELVDGDAVLVEGGKITGVVPIAQVGPDWPKLDAAGAYLLPGLIDVHAHLFAPVRSVEAPFDYGYLVQCFFSHYAPHRREYLEKGVTAIRDDGGPASRVFALRAAIADHRLLGPRIFAVGRLVTAPHGHPVATIWKAFPALAREGAVLADSQQSLTRGLERNYREGPPDAVKFIYGTIGLAPQLLAPELLRTGIAWSSEHHLISVVHAETTDEVREAVADGATGVEHVASVEKLPEEVRDLIRMRRPFLDPTFGEYETALQLRHVDEAGRAESLRRKSAFVRQMYEAGGVLVIGTDAPLVPYGAGLHDEFKYFQRVGFSPAEILTFDTINNSAYLGAADHLGRIEVGYDADLILVRANPLQDLSTLRAPEWVLRDGVAVVHP